MPRQQRGTAATFHIHKKMNLILEYLRNNYDK
jgi:hypothetical protein